MIDRNGKTVVPFAPGSKGNVRVDAVPVDESGNAIVALLKEAADTARATCIQAINAAETASNQLRAAEDRIKELEAEVRHYHDRAARAEKWLARVHHEIEDKFFGPSPAACAG
jgi:hypothetical protein